MWEKTLYIATPWRREAAKNGDLRIREYRRICGFSMIGKAVPPLSSCTASSRSGDAGGDQEAPDLFLGDDLDAELLGLGGLARADVGAADQHVGVGRHRRGARRARALAQPLEGRTRH